MNRNQAIGIVVALLVVGYVTGVFVRRESGNGAEGATNGTATSTGMQYSTPGGLTLPTVKETFMNATELKIEDQQVGTGIAAVAGSHVYVHYVGRLTDGTVFDSSIPRGTPIDFQLGSGYVIKGWDEGLVGMKVGGKRRLTIPPAKAYGDRAIGSIPAGSTLIFDVELMDVK